MSKQIVTLPVRNAAAWPLLAFDARWAGCLVDGLEHGQVVALAAAKPVILAQVESSVLDDLEDHGAAFAATAFGTPSPEASYNLLLTVVDEFGNVYRDLPEDWFVYIS